MKRFGFFKNLSDEKTAKWFFEDFTLEILQTCPKNVNPKLMKNIIHAYSKIESHFYKTECDFY